MNYNITAWEQYIMYIEYWANDAKQQPSIFYSSSPKTFDEFCEITGEEMWLKP